MAVDLSTQYADAQEFLPSTKWLVEMALKDTSQLYNQIERPSCKACGALVPRKDQERHLKEHAFTLKLITKPPVVKGKAMDVNFIADSKQASAAFDAALESVQTITRKKMKSQLQLDIEATLFDTLTERVEGLGLDYGFGPLTTLLAEGILAVTTEGDAGESAICPDCDE